MSAATAQLIAYESFTGIPTGSGLTGSGTGAFGWTDSSWSVGTDARFQVVNPTPHLIYQLNGGPLTTMGARGHAERLAKELGA